MEKIYWIRNQYSESTYPPFVTGPSYLVSRSAVDLILPEALEHPFIHLEDVFITGIVAERTDVPRRLATEFRNNAVPIPARFLGCTLLRTISIHKVPPEEQSQLTKMAKNPVCGTAKVWETILPKIGQDFFLSALCCDHPLFKIYLTTRPLLRRIKWSFSATYIEH